MISNSLNITQLKALHKRAIEDIKGMRTSTASPRINIQLFSEQHNFAIEEQQRYIDELAEKIKILEGPSFYSIGERIKIR